MKLTTARLRQIIKEELNNVMREGRSPSKDMEDYLYGRGQSQIPDPEYSTKADVEQAMDAIERVVVAKAAYDALKGPDGRIDDTKYIKLANRLYPNASTGVFRKPEYAERLKKMKDAWMKKYNARLDREKRNYDDAMKPNLDDLNPSNYRNPDYDPFADGD